MEISSANTPKALEVDSQLGAQKEQPTTIYSKILGSNNRKNVSPPLTIYQCIDL
jgi:hypothetical protein